MKRLLLITTFFSLLMIPHGNSVFNFGKNLLFLKNWTETTVSDFSDSELEDVVVTNLQGGEVELSPAMAKIIADYQDENVARFVAWDSSHSYYLASWVENNNVYVQKRSGDGIELGKPIRVNERDDCVGYSGACCTTLMNDGAFMVTWVNWGSDSFDSNMYAQLFKDDSVRVGGNFKINEGENAFNIPPIVFANNKQKAFWLLFEEGNHYEGWKIFVKTYDLDGSFINFFRLNAENLTYLETVYSVCVNNDGEFIVAWTGGANSVSSYQDVYARKFNHRGESLGPAFKVNDDTGYNDQYQPAVCVDDSSNFLVVWVDMRDNTFEAGPYDYNIYGQMYAPNCDRIGRNLMINDTLNEDDREPDIQFIHGAFQISWHSWYAPGRITKTYVTSWRYRPILSGALISSVFDVGPSFTKYDSIGWDAHVPENTSIRFKLRSAQRLAEINQALWYGPSGTDSYYSTPTGEYINQLHNGDRFIQYKAQLSTVSPVKTPTLNSITVSYSSSDLIPPSAPSDFKATPGHSTIILRWDANAEIDLANYFLYRGEAGGVYDSDWTKIIAPDLTTFSDTSAITSTVYFYSLAAVDSSHNEGPLSEEASAMPYGIGVYADDDSEPSGDGTYDRPFKSIQEALTKAIYGDSIIVLPGTYRETVDMKTGISLLGSGAKLTLLMASDDKDYVVSCANNASLKGFTIVRNKPTIQMAVKCLEVSPIIEDNIIANYSGSTLSGPAIWAVTAFPKIRKNFLLDFEQGVLALNYQGIKGRRISITNNIIKASEVGIDCSYYTSAEISNNTVLANNQVCILSHANGTIEIKNNILHGSGPTVTLGIVDRGSKLSMDYNDLWNMRENYSDVTPGPHDISVDPSFANKAKNDYRLLNNSPCIDSGDPNPLFNDHNGSRNDMGAYGGPDPIDPLLTSSLVKSVGITGFSGFPSDTVSTFLWLDDPVGLAKADFEIQFDPSILDVTKVFLTSQTEGFEIEKSEGPGSITISMQSSTEISGGDGRILELFFCVNENAKSGDASPLSIKKAAIFDGLGSPIILKNISDGAFVASYVGQNGHYVFVDAENEGSEDGSFRSPFRTIQHALEQASTGDTVLVAAGNYFGRLVMKEGIFLRGAGASVTFLHPRVGSIEEVAYFENITSSELSGFTLKTEENLPYYPLIICRASSPTITRNRFEALPYPLPLMECSDHSNPLIERNCFLNGGIYINQSSPLFINNSITCELGTVISVGNNASPQLTKNKLIGNEAIISIYNSSAMITGNWIVCGKGEATGISLHEANQVDVSNNIIEGPIDDAIGIDLFNSSQITIRNNVINTNSRGLWEENSVMTSLNNIIMGGRGFGIQASQNATADYNDVWNNSMNYFHCTPGTNDISADPHFIDLAKSNYHLQAGSPCINAGHPDASYDDLDGSRNDIGAYGGPGAQVLEDYLSKVRLELPSIEAGANDTVQVELSGSAISGSAELDLSVSYNQQLLKFLNARTATTTSHFSLTKAEEAANVQLSLISTEGIQSDSGSIIVLSFKTGNQFDAEASIKITQASIKDEVKNDLEIGEIVNGKIKITSTGVKNSTTGAQFNRYDLAQNYPNPFNSATMIKYALARPERVRLRIYDMLGREVRTLVDRNQSPGDYAVQWDGRNDYSMAVASGIYFYKITTSSFSKTRKLALIR